MGHGVRYAPAAADFTGGGMPAFGSGPGLGFLMAAFEGFAQGAAALYVVAYVEVRPPAKAEAATLLKSHRDTTRRDEGNLRSEVVQHATRPGQFVLLTAWKDQKAYEAHAAVASTREFRDKLQGLRNGPADDRFHNALSVGDLDGPRPARGVYVVTHVDVIPPRKDDAVGLLKNLGYASRRDDGNVRYEIVQQTNRPNHFTVVEIWNSREALDAHGMAPHVREFRDKLSPMSRALSDERLYERVN